MSSEIEVQKNIPIPAPKCGPGWRYPFDQMGVGDSFFVPADERPIRNVIGAVKASARWRGLKVAVRRLTEEGAAGIRVWLVGQRSE